MGVLPRLFKLWPWIDLDLFYIKVKFGYIGFCMGESVFFFFGKYCSLKHSAKWVNEVERGSEVNVILWTWPKVIQISKLNVWLWPVYSGEQFRASWPSCLRMGDMFACFHTSGSFPLSNDFWKISCRMGESSSCNVCRMMGFNLSGPAALCGFKLRRSLSMPSAEMLMSGILGLGLGWKGRSTPESCRSCSDFWARDLRLTGVLGLNTDWIEHLECWPYPFR